jgi:tetratricopeptide (TPR) repeat protein
MHTAGRVLIFSFVLLCWLALPEVMSAQSQDDQPHITPRKGAPEPTPKPKATPSPQPQQPPLDQPQPSASLPATLERGESSSRDSQAEFNPAPRVNEPAPAPAADEGTFLPYDPHRASKDVEVGNWYLRQKNYRAALDRFNDALLYKANDAEATFGLAVTEEKLDLLSQSYKNYQAYLKMLDSGPHAKECQEAIKRIGPHLDVRNDPKRQAEHDIDVGETYLSLNKYDAARERFEEALLLDPDNPVACFRLAQSLKGLQQFDPARRFYQKYIDLAPRGKFVSDAKKSIAEISETIGK